MRKNVILAVLAIGCLLISGCTKENDSYETIQEQQKETVGTEAVTEIETQTREGIYGIESSLNIEEMNRIKEKYSYIFDELELPESVIYTSILSVESDDGEICIAFTGVDDAANGINEVSNYGRIIRYRDNDGSPQMTVTAIPYQISKSKISALYYNSGICVIGTKNGAGNEFGKVMIYRQYEDKNGFDEYSIDCGEYGVSGENSAYVSDIYINDDETYCDVVTAEGDRAVVKLPFFEDTMRTQDEYAASILGLDDWVHDGSWNNGVAMYESDIDEDGIDEYVISSGSNCFSIVRSDDFTVIYTVLSEYLRLDDYLSDVSMTVRDVLSEDEPGKFKYLTFTLTGIDGESFEQEVLIPADYSDKYTGTSLNFSYAPIYDEFDGTLTMNGSIVADYDLNSYAQTSIATVHAKMVYDEMLRGITLSGEYVLGPADTRKMPDENIRLDDCEVMTGTREEIAGFIGTTQKMEAYPDWEMFLIKIDNHWRVGYYKDGTAVIIYYNSGCYRLSDYRESYEGKVCIVAQADKEEGFKFGEWQLENLGVDITSQSGIMSVSDNDGDGSRELMAGVITDDDAHSLLWYNEIELKK